MGTSYENLVGKADDHIRAFAITKDMKDSWNVNTCDIWSAALRNTSRLLPYEFMTIEEKIRRTMPSIPFNVDTNSNEESSLYVLTNDVGVSGASVMFYENLLRDFTYKFEVDRVIIIPSSIDEVLLIPVKDGGVYRQQELREMIRGVNATCVDADLVLTDTPYIYDRTKDTIRYFNE